MKKILQLGALMALLLPVALLLNRSHLNIGENEAAELDGDKLTQVEGRYEQEYIMTHDPATHTIPRERLLIAKRIADQKRTQMAQMAEDQLPIYWNERGPNNVGGRTRGLLIDANDPSGKTVWAAGVDGGLWRTTNIDASNPNWVQINDFFANLAITTIAQDPSNPNIMYFGTGEGYGNYDAVGGLGIWRSGDGGANWARLPLNFSNVNKIVIDNSGTVYAATDGGLQRSTDNGVTFPFIFASGSNVQDFEIAANGDLFATRPGIGIFRFQSGGSWTQMTNGLPTTNFGRVEIGCAPSNSNILYAAYQKTNKPNKDSVLGVFQSTDGGTNWSALSTPALGGQSWYNLIIAVDPNDANRVWVAAVGMFVSGDGGMNWNSVSVGHTDHHAMVYRAGNSKEMVFGCDGGVYRTTNADAGSPTLDNKNMNYNVTQFLSCALHPNSGSNYIIGGCQDNGTPRFNSPGINSTVDISGGDGGYCFIDQDNANIQITSYVNRSFDLSTNGGSSFSSGFFGNNPLALFITPAEYDDTANILYTSDGVDTLARVSDIGGSNTFTEIRITQFNGDRISAIAVSPVTPNRLYIGTENGSFVRIDNADNSGTMSVTALTSPVGGYISCIEIEPGNDSHLIATCSNYGVNSVLESTDGGMNWVDLDNDLPDMPVRWALFNAFNHDQLIIATELGVWTTDNLDGVNTKWWPTNTFGLANVRVDMLQYRSSDHLVAAATHGRGLFTTDYFTLLNTCSPNLFVGGAIPSGLYMAEDFINSTGTIDPGGKVIMQAGDHIDLKAGFWAKQGSDFWALIRECNISPQLSPTQNNWTLQRGAEDSGHQDGKTVAAGDLSMSCYPNPAQFRLSVQAEMPQDGHYSLYIRNLQGKMIRQVAVHEWTQAGQINAEINAGDFEPGIYFLTFQTDDKALTQRFVVAR